MLATAQARVARARAVGSAPGLQLLAARPAEPARALVVLQLVAAEELVALAPDSRMTAASTVCTLHSIHPLFDGVVAHANPRLGCGATFAAALPVFRSSERSTMPLRGVHLRVTTHARCARSAQGKTRACCRVFRGNRSGPHVGYR